jgi:signal transduction histidine kinase
MRERAESIGGTFEVRRRHKGGTRIAVTAPADRAAPDS